MSDPPEATDTGTSDAHDPSSASPLAEVADHIRQGDPVAALAGLKERIRSEPGNADLRLSLAQLEAIAGNLSTTNLRTASLAPSHVTETAADAHFQNRFRRRDLHRFNTGQDRQ